ADGKRRRLDVRGFNQVLRLGPGWVEAEGMIPYEDLTRECLAQGVMPTVVPQLKTITLCDAHADLFYGFPNSYGTLGYALRVKARTIPVKPYVHLAHVGFSSAAQYFQALEKHLRAGDADFVDGTVFAPDQLFITLGRFSETAPYTSDYTYERI